ncbi:hypothetical protein B0H17DRAFT_911343, partial [Mycena rosella]
RVSTNNQAKNVQLVTWDGFGRLTIPRIVRRYKSRFWALWYVTEGMGAPPMNRVTMLRKRRPHAAV